MRWTDHGGCNYGVGKGMDRDSTVSIPCNKCEPWWRPAGVGSHMASTRRYISPDPRKLKCCSNDTNFSTKGRCPKMQRLHSPPTKPPSKIRGNQNTHIHPHLSLIPFLGSHTHPQTCPFDRTIFGVTCLLPCVKNLCNNGLLSHLS